MELINDFKYYTDKSGNTHSAGYLLNEKCTKEDMQNGGGKSLAIPGGLFWDKGVYPPKHKMENKGLVNEILFDKLFSCGCVEEKTGKHTRKRKMPSKKKTRRV